MRTEDESDLRPRNPSQVSVKTVLTVSFTVLGVLAVVWLVWHAPFALSLLVTSALLAVALDHAVEAMTRKRLSRKAAIGVVATMLVLFFVALGLLFIPPLVKQMRELVQSAPEYAARVRESNLYQRIDQRVGLSDRIDQMKQAAGAAAGQSVESAVKAVTGVVTGLAAVVTVFFLTLFMLLYGGTLVHALVQETAPERRGRYARVLRKIYASIGGYISGLAVICGVNAALTTVVLAVLRVPFFLPLGILSGLSSLVPLAGNTIAGTLLALIALASGGVWKGLAVAAYYIVYQQFENHVLGPMVYKRSVNLNPLVVIIGLLLFAELWGVLGAVVAIPVIATLQIILREMLAMRRELLELPKPTPPPADGTVELEDAPPMHS